MNNLSMKTKFFLLIGSVIFVFLIAMSLIQIKTSEITSGFNRFYTENYNVSLDIEHIKEKQVDIVLNVRGLQIAYLLSLDNQIPGYLSTISNSYEVTPELLNTLEMNFIGDADALKLLSSRVIDFQAKTKTFVKAMEDAPDNKAPFPIFSAFITSYNDLMAHISTLTNNANQQAISAQIQAEKLIKETRFYFWGCIAVALLLASILGYAISRNIVIRIQSVRDASLSVSNGYLNKPLKNITGTDELSELANSINTTTEKLRSVMLNVLQSVDVINDNSENVLKANQRIGDVSHEVTDNTSQVMTSLEQMAVTNRGISESSQNSVVAANEINIVATESLDTASTTLNAINDLVVSLQDTASVVTKLKDETTNIEAILDVIRGISEQTNLLALNAAIEAARAGEQGRGFAVVADEVRGLAQRSQDSVNEIETLLSELNNASSKAVDRMDLSLEMVATSRTQVEKSNQLTSNIMEKVAHITEQAKLIASSAEAQSHISEEITRKMSHVQSLTSQSAEFANNTGNEMASTSTDVKQQLSFFKV